MKKILNQISGRKAADSARLGKLVPWAMIMSAVIVTAVFFYITDKPLPQTPRINGNTLKNNPKLSARILSGIKKNNGVIVMGTSETEDPLDGQNFWGFLDKSPDFPHYTTVLAGAGRTFYMWIPFFVEYQKELQGTKIIYYINPVYWSKSKNRYNPEYFSRYNAPAVVCSHRDELTGFGQFNSDKFCRTTNTIESYKKFFPYSEQSGNTVAQKLYLLADETEMLLKSNFHYYQYHFHYAFYQLSGINYPGFEEKDRPLLAEQNRIQEKYHQEWNVSTSYYTTFTAPGKDNPDPYLANTAPDSFINIAFENFLKVAKKSNADILFVIGPHNGIYFDKHGIYGANKNYELVIKRIREKLQSNKMRFIDTSGLSRIQGTFIDPQHHSKSASLEIARRIEKQYADKN